jgi:hypothetical protein
VIGADRQRFGELLDELEPIVLRLAVRDEERERVSASRAPNRGSTRSESDVPPMTSAAQSV